MTKEKGRQWDGKSRVSNETYRQNWNDIFKKEKTLHEELMEGFNKEQHGTTKETDGTAN
jgi:hypothetical protein